MATGRYSSVGSETDDEGSGLAGTAPKEPGAKLVTEPSLRTVAVLDPDFVDHARVIHVSGVTTADKRATRGSRHRP